MARLVLLLLTMAVTAIADDPISYIYKQGDHTHIRSSAGIESMVALSKRWSGEFVWVKHRRREYLIRDAHVLAEVRAAFAPMHAFEPQMEAAEEKLRPLERRMDELEDRIDRIDDKLGDEDQPVPNRAALEAELARAEAERKALEGSYQAADRESERMEREMDRLEEIAEAKFEKIVLKAIEQGRTSPVR